MRISDWSSDVCSSDLRATRIRSNRLSAPAAKFKAPDTPPASSLGPEKPGILAGLWSGRRVISHVEIGRASCGERVCVRVDLGGRRIIKKKNREKNEL